MPSAENDGGKWWIGNAETDPLLPAENDVPSVGSLIRAELARREWTQTDLAEVLDRPLQFVNEVCMGKKELTRLSALQIAAALGHDAEWWLRAQDANRLTLIDQGDALNPIRLRAALARVIPPADGGKS